jgi:hypothetical protein
MTLHAAFKGHGTFVYNAQSTLERYKDASGTGPGLVKAFKAMDFSSAWIRLFGVAGAVAHAPTQELINALRGGGIALAGWGYCHGAEWETDLRRSTFHAWDRIVGFNWWHAGGVGAKAMSPVMVDLLSGANLNDKGYADA